jgi:putative redox protein
MPLIEQVRFKSAQGPVLQGLLHGPVAQGCVVSCHGMLADMNGHKHHALAASLAARGVGMLRFNFAGVQGSEGRFYDLSYRARMADLEGALNFLQGRGVARFALFGSSMGGAVAYLTAARNERVVGVASLGAIGQLAGLIEAHPEAQAAWLACGQVQTPRGAVGRGFWTDSLAHDVPAAVGVLRAPILVVHGELDTVVPPSDAHDIAVAGRRASLDLVLGADHGLSQAVHLRPAIGRIATFLTEALA